jgi:HK97 family phage prohead protease
MGDTESVLARRTITLDTGRRKVDAPVDVMGRERWRARMDTQSVELRADNENAANFNGHAAMYNKRTWIGPRSYGFWEQVAPDAFTKTIGDGDVRLLINHDPNLLLARNKAGTLRLASDQFGLATDADLDRRQSYTNDVVISLERGDISQMSFAFEVVRESWEILGDDTELRTLEEVRLWDVSVVTYPAYEDTDAGLRAWAFEEICRSADISPAQRSKLLADLTGIADVPVIGQQPPEPGSSTQVSSQPGSSTGDTLALRKRRHQSLAVLHGIKREEP